MRSKYNALAFAKALNDSRRTPSEPDSHLAKRVGVSTSSMGRFLTDQGFKNVTPSFEKICQTLQLNKKDFIVSPINEKIEQEIAHLVSAFAEAAESVGYDPQNAKSEIMEAMITNPHALMKVVREIKTEPKAKAFDNI